MNKMKRRSVICIFFAVFLFIGLSFYVKEWAEKGHKWISFSANKHIFYRGNLIAGRLEDRNGKILLVNKKGSPTRYNKSKAVRKACVHLTGDRKANIATGANVVLRDIMIGYNKVTGVKTFGGNGKVVRSTIDANACKAARKALKKRSGTVGVYNYKTGEIICMVSSPNYDPQDPPELSKTDTSGTYINRLTSAKIVPGSIFKLVTTTAALENIKDYKSWRYQCRGTYNLGKHRTERITCQEAHGRVGLKKALAVSCNCGFGQLAIDLGASTLKKYVDKLKLTHSYNIDGISTKKSSFDIPDNKVQLAWSGIGQHKDLVNPFSMMVFMGAIANGGKTKNPHLIKSVKFANGWNSDFHKDRSVKRLLSAGTSNILDDYMKNNVEKNYGIGRFPGLDIYAKSGTAETVKSRKPHAWFTGYIKNKAHPYAFIVLVEEGGTGYKVAGKVANEVLQYLVNK